MRAFAKCKVKPELLDGSSGSAAMLADQTHLVVSAGSKMQAHLFAWSSETQALRHLCKYNQQVFKKQQNMTGKKEFGLSTDVQDFRIMAAAVM